MTLTLHPEYQGLLRDVIGTPEDDTPRRIIADWLEDQGEAKWAQFIRWQLGDGRWQSAPSIRPRDWFRPWWPERAEKYRIRHRGENGESLRDYIVHNFNSSPYRCHLEIRRGFVHIACVPIGVWRGIGTDLQTKQPVTAVRLSDRWCGANHDFGSTPYFIIETVGDAAWPGAVSADVFSLLKGGTLDGTMIRRYRTITDASADLSQALLALCEPKKP